MRWHNRWADPHHHQHVLSFGDDRAKKAFLILDLTLPFTLAAISCLTKDIDGFADLVSCFGLTEHVQKKYDTWEKKMQKFFMCNIDWTEKDISDRYVLYIIKQCLCGIKSAIVLIINTNFPEAFLYFKIFQKMKR